MLVKCPKCGFDQPKETYCAKCGIEMDSYKPAKTPFWKNFFKSPLFSLVIFLAVGYAVVLYLRNSPSPFKSSHSSPPQRQSVLPPPPPPPPPPLMATTTASPTPEPSITPLAQNERGNPPITPPSPPLPSSAPTQAVNTAPPLKGPPSSTEAGGLEQMSDAATKTINTESIKGPLQLDIHFVEAPMSLVHQFHTEASDDSGGDSGDMNYAIVKNAPKWLKHSSFVELDHFVKKVPAVKQKLQWFSGAQEPETGAPFGLNFQISIQERNGGRINGDIFISRSLVEHNGGEVTTQRKEFLTHFETDVGSLIGISGLMPHTIFSSEDRDWLQDSLLKVFLSRPYLQNETELLILLQFKSDSK